MRKSRGVPEAGLTFAPAPTARAGARCLRFVSGLIGRTTFEADSVTIAYPLWPFAVASTTDVPVTG